MPYRTSDLCRVKALRAFLMRPGVYACVAFIRRFRPIERVRVPLVFSSVLVGLLHGCCAGTLRQPSCVGACWQRHTQTRPRCVSAVQVPFIGWTYTTVDVNPRPQRVVEKLHGGWACSARSRLLSHRLFTRAHDGQRGASPRRPRARRRLDPRRTRSVRTVPDAHRHRMRYGPADPRRPSESYPFHALGE
jgi:hypothetical protein